MASKSRITFTWVCVQIKPDSSLPDVIFIDLGGDKIKQQVLYNWKPLVCKVCSFFSHDEAKCPKNPSPNPLPLSLPLGEVIENWLLSLLQQQDFLPILRPWWLSLLPKALFPHMFSLYHLIHHPLPYHLAKTSIIFIFYHHFLNQPREDLFPPDFKHALYDPPLTAHPTIGVITCSTTLSPTKILASKS